MPTASKSTTSKKPAAKKTVAPKTTAKPKPAPVEEPTKAEEKDPLVNIILPKDPNFPPDQQYWEISINGVMQRFPRGVMIELPRSIVDLFNFKASLLRQGRAQYGGYENGSMRIG